MKNLYVNTISTALVLFSCASYASPITDTFADGDTLTATKLNNTKDAVNDNDSRITAVEDTQSSQISIKQLGYAWANSASPLAEYTPDTTYSYNSSGQGITISKGSTGNYIVTFAGLAGDGGTVSVTSYGGGNNNTCNVSSWSGSNWQVDVQCFTPTGDAVDSQFTITVQSM